MDSTLNAQPRANDLDNFSIKDFFQICKANWKWFALSVFFFVGLAAFYIIRKEPVFERQEQILVKDKDSGGTPTLPSSFSSLGLMGGNTSVYNELIAITSPAIMSEVVKRLDLTMDYTWRKWPHNVTLFGTSLPMKVKMIDVLEQRGASFRIDLRKDGSGRLYKFIEYTPDGKEKYDGEVELKNCFGVFKTPLGHIEIAKSDFYKNIDNFFKDDDEITIEVSKSATQNAIEYYMEHVTGDLTDEDAEVIDLTIKDENVERANAILTTILDVYKENWVEDKNKMTRATSEFINDRLAVIQQELGDADKTLADLQAGTGTISLGQSAEISLQKEASNEDRIVNLQNKITLSKYLDEYVRNPANKYNIIPVNLGFGEGEAESQIVAYNELLLARNTLIANSSEHNPLLEEYERRINVRRDIIIKTLENQIQNLQMGLETAYRERAKAEGRMVSTPAKTLPIITEGRQQKVKEGLYMFLLEKREENELSQKFTADNLRILTPPMGSLEPVSPKKKIILILAFIFSIGLPTFILYLQEVLNTKIRGKKDLENVKMPFAGEIPHVGKKRKFKLDGKGKLIGKKEDTAPISVVAEGKRDVVNEAFRVIRSNLDFMAGKDKKCQVVLITSFNPGSGKSFISYNLGLSFAIKKKRVLLIDCDLRHGSSSMYVGMPKKGLSDYLTDHTDDWRSLLKTVPDQPDLTIMPIGKMPPNPAELLENGRLDKLVEEAKKDYDYILLDCPPVNIVVDTNIVGQLADRTLFVVRAGLLERSALKELDELYADKKFNNMSLILNGTEAIHSRYYTYGNYQHLL